MYNFILILFCIPFLLFSKHKICVAAIFQNEARFLDEWIAYHKNLGVTHFQLYNNNSRDDYKSVLLPWIEQNIVTLVEWPHVPKENDWKQFSFTIQTGAYNHAISTLRGKTKWLALIDTDEFLTLMSDKSLYEILDSFPPRAAIYVNWCMYGCNDIWDCQGNLISKMSKHGKKTLPQHLYCKSIVQPKYVKSCENPHYCDLRGKLYNTDFEIVDPMNVKKVCWDILRLNHYWSRDRKFLEEVKIPRRLRWNNPIHVIYEHESLFNEVSD